MRPPSISFFFPCYNDACTIACLVLLAHRKLEAFTPDFEVLVVDDGSQDRSLSVLAGLKHIYPDTLRIIRHGVNRGYGAALTSGFQAARKEWVGYTDGDAQYDLEELDAMFPLLTEDIDWVQGYKGTRRDPWYRKVVGSVYQYAVKFAFALDIRDVDCDFRMVRRSFLDKIDLSSTTGAICIEFAKKMELMGARTQEVRVSHHFRLYGTSQFFNFVRIARTLVNISRLWVECLNLRLAAPPCRPSVFEVNK